MKHGLDFGGPVFWGIIVIGIIAFGCGFVLVWVILRPIERFVERARQHPALSRAETDQGEKKNKSIDKLEQFSQVFEQLTDVLSHVDAREYFPEIVGDSRALRGVLSQIIKVAPTDSTVLILGESGTGKEIIATAIYNNSLRKKKPFIKLNCVAIPEGLWESELFGHEKGAFTGATAKKAGKFELANGGSLFLDEIGDMPLETQGKILRALQEREFERVGGVRTIKVDVRFIAATNKDLSAMVKQGKFREDLYYRLDVFSLKIPSLKERKEDIPILLDHFLKDMKKDIEISPMVMQMLMSYSWPGNIRELKNTIERASVMCEDKTMENHHLPETLKKGFGANVSPSLNQSMSIDEQLAEIEKNMIMNALRQTNGIQVRAAEILKINQRGLWHRTKKYNIDVKEFKKTLKQ